MASVAVKIAPLLISSALYSLGSGLFITLMPLRLDALGYTNELIGFVVTANMVGFIVGCLLTQPLIRSVGHIRTYAGFAAISAVTVLSHEWSDAPLAWILLRACNGFAVAALSIVTESWLNELSTNERRGSVLTGYVLTMGLFYGLGQLAASDFAASGSQLLVLTASLYAISMVPLTAVKVESPRAPARLKLHLLQAFKVSPSGAVGSFATGMIAMTFAGIGPLYGQAVGMTQATIAVLMAASQIGGMALQFPLGFASDRLDRRYVLIFMHVALILVAAGFIVSEGASPFWVMMALFAAFGGFSEALYPVSVAHANDRAKPDEYVAVSSNLLMLWALGGAIGPVIGTFTIDNGGPHAFFWYVALISLLLGLFTLWRVLRRRRLDAETTLEEFVVYPTTSPAVYEWVPHTPLKVEEKPRTPGKGTP